ncbi:hypothetical protein Pcinc_008422 [Petrolisthes cinctipes]|uniref:Uncharacterized protein n=1 Tax=Petrolisthes cinctipes TaxID=88211 RepID=A0AAE1FVJ0_PETCI|nr:hypothetical protein Pcinc_016744 [Petrolisthes cinctipes]KAK3887481.1 hypothetical protein Pcinc_008422 [Petrolisthes cinctipes]
MIEKAMVEEEERGGEGDGEAMVEEGEVVMRDGGVEKKESRLMIEKAMVEEEERDGERDVEVEWRRKRAE